MFLAAPAIASAATDYVCQSGQTGPGGTPCAFSTVGAVNSASLGSGDTVEFYAGDTFTDDTLYPESGVTYTSYVPTGSSATMGIIKPPAGSSGVDLYGGISNATVQNLDFEGGSYTTSTADGAATSDCCGNNLNDTLKNNTF
ncbi:MAG TPA: hypothetical protein VGI87_15040, partial [Solirubrobacteraceae bacterium]